LDDVIGGRCYDLIIFGATGYTGGLMVEHLDALLSLPGAPKRNWAIAGRNKGKLERIKNNCKTEPGVCVVETSEEYPDLASSTSVLISAVGPYMLLGSQIVAACVESKTQYIDVTGEIVWMGRMMDSHHTQAKEHGVMIVHAAGLMSVPPDIALHLLCRKLGRLNQFRWYQMERGVSAGGTSFMSGYAGYEEMFSSEMRVLLDPFSLGGERKCGVRPEDRDPVEVVEDDLFPGVWLARGHSSSLDPKVQRRSCGLFEADGDDAMPSYGENVKIIERYCFAQKNAAEISQMRWKEPTTIQELMKSSETMAKAQKRGSVPPPGVGPTCAARTFGATECWGVAEGENGDWAHVHFIGPDPGGDFTAMSAVTCALVMIEEADMINSKSRGGVVTPAYAMHGSTFVDRLVSTPFAGLKGRNVKFDVVDGKPEGMLQAIHDFEEKSGDLQLKIQAGAVEGLCEPPEMTQ